MYRIYWKKRWQGNNAEWISGISRYKTENEAQEQVRKWEYLFRDNCYHISRW
jgi:hypothetical protein